MIDVESKIEEEAAPELIATHYLSSVDDLVEHVRAASLLGLGVRVSSYLESDDESGTFGERWELDLLTASPVHEDESVSTEDVPAE